MNHIFPLSAKNKHQLENKKSQLAKYLLHKTALQEHVDLCDLAYSLGKFKGNGEVRTAYCVNSIDHLINRLRQDTTFAGNVISQGNKLVFMFPGQGTQYANMAKSLYEEEPFFREQLHKCITIANTHLPVDLFNVMFPDEKPYRYNINSTEWSQISIFIVQYCLALLLQENEVTPDAFIGYSLGEYTAATLSGVMSLADAIKVVISRGRLLQSIEPGGMLAINGNYETLRDLIDGCGCELSIVNSTDDFVVAGGTNKINELYAELENQKVNVFRVNIAVAGHSSLMNQLREEFKGLFHQVRLQPPSKLLISNFTGGIADADVATSEYWFKQIRGVVQFAKGIETLINIYRGKVTFIEVGAGKGLCYFVNKLRNAHNIRTILTAHCLPSEKELKNAAIENSNVADKANIMARLWMTGVIENVGRSLRPNPTVLEEVHFISTVPEGPDLADESSGYGFDRTDERQIADIFAEVLNIQHVSVTDDFFKIGGNSISALHVSHLIKERLGYAIAISDVFRCKTPTALSQSPHQDEAIIIPSLRGNEAELSFAQQRVWFIEQYQRGTNAYYIPALYQLPPDSSVEGFKYALQKIIARHEVLRTTIEQRDDRPVAIQMIHDEQLAINEYWIDASEDLMSMIRAEVNKPFDLQKNYPIRVCFYHIQPGLHVEGAPIRKLMLVNVHHIAFDGWSLDVLFPAELMAYYNAYVAGDGTFELTMPQVQYKDYAVWQRSYLNGEVFEKQIQYWKNRLSGYQPLQLLTDYPRPQELDYRGADSFFSLSTDLSNKLRYIAKELGTTLHSVLLSGINVFLNKYTGQDDLVIGCPIANRHYKQTEKVLGFFVNTQAHRTKLNEEQTFYDLIRRVHVEQAAAQLHQDVPLERIVDEMQVARDTSRHPIFQVLFSVQSFGNQSKHKNQKKYYLEAQSLSEVYQVARFDLSIFIDDTEDEFLGRINYAVSLFSSATIERMIIHLKYLLSQLAEFPDRHYSKIGLLSGQEYDQTIRRWNETYCALPLNKSIHHLIAEHVSKRPQAIAVSHNGLHLTYQQLEDRSNQLAHLLVNKFGIADEEIIPVVLERSCELLISLLAILKAGGAYLPLDPMLPVERKLMILKDCSATVMIGAASLLDLDRQWAATNIENLILFQSEVSIDFQRNFEVPFDDRATGGSQKLFFDGACHLMRAARRIFTESDINEQSASAINKHYPGNQLAYVIYTSGSTGLPKGAMIERNGMLNHLYAKVNSLKMTESTVMAQTSSQSFDVSIWQFLSPLLAGGKVIIYDNDVILDSVRLAREFHRDQVDIFEVVPSYLASFLEEVHEKGLSSLLGGLRYLIVNGEVFPPALAARWFEFCPNVPLINAYGPTEASDDISQHVMSSVPETHRIPLGKVLQNLSVYVVGKDMSLCPVGVKGEITIAGIGVGRGYLNNPKLTSHKFIENPFGEPGSRLYRTGDWGRWLADGTLDYLGREDDQVKVRGYRIELAEIEQALLKIPGIRQSCVVVRHRKDRDETNKYIVGYYIPDGNMSLPESVILEELSKAVPDYMIPSALVELSTFPLTTSGKLNKNSLPDPDFKSGAEFVPPITQAERMVSDIWKQALSVDRVGLGDDFFRIGGNSILAIHVSHRMSKALGVDIKVADLFRSKNISKLLHNIHTPQSTESNVLLRL